jgi:hypothetical protein
MKALVEIIKKREIEKNRQKFYVSIIASLTYLVSLIYFCYVLYYYFKVLTSKPKNFEALVFQIAIYTGIIISFFLMLLFAFFSVKFEINNKNYIKSIEEKALNLERSMINWTDDVFYNEIFLLLNESSQGIEKFFNDLKSYALKIHDLKCTLNEYQNLKNISEEENEAFISLLDKDISSRENNKNQKINELLTHIERYLFYIIKVDNRKISKINEEYEGDLSQERKEEIISFIADYMKEYVKYFFINYKKEMLEDEVEMIANEIHFNFFSFSGENELINLFKQYVELREKYSLLNKRLNIVEKFLERNKNLNKDSENNLKEKKESLSKEMLLWDKDISRLKDKIYSHEFSKKHNIKELFSLSAAHKEGAKFPKDELEELYSSYESKTIELSDYIEKWQNQIKRLNLSEGTVYNAVHPLFYKNQFRKSQSSSALKKDLQRKASVISNSSQSIDDLMNECQEEVSKKITLSQINLGESFQSVENF